MFYSYVVVSCKLASMYACGQDGGITKDQIIDIVSHDCSVPVLRFYQIMLSRILIELDSQ